MEERSKTESRQSDIAKFVKRKLMSLQSNPNEAAVRAILAKCGAVSGNSRVQYRNSGTCSSQICLSH